MINTPDIGATVRLKKDVKASLKTTIPAGIYVFTVCGSPVLMATSTQGYRITLDNWQEIKANLELV